jgi:hypothetical protein
MTATQEVTRSQRRKLGLVLRAGSSDSGFG